MRDGHIQYLRNLQVDLEDAAGEEDGDTDLRLLIADKDDGISCEVGIRDHNHVWRQEPPDHSG